MAAYTTIDDGGVYSNPKIYTGTGSSLAITGVGFQPDFVWINGESLGDEDPALNNLSDLPVVFIFDIKLLKSLDLSTKRIIFFSSILRKSRSS